MTYYSYIFVPFQNQDTIDVGTIKPLMEPDTVAFSFETIGWSILFWIGVVLILTLTIRSILSFKKNKYKRDALRILEGLTLDGSTNVNQHIATQLKLVAINSYGREIVSPLSGKEWTYFLQSKVRYTEFDNLDSFLMKCLYQNKEDLQQTEQFLTYSKKWIKTHA